MGKENGQFPVRFLLSTNLPGSMTRITADTATVFARLGIPTTVMFPAIDWWDYKFFLLSRLNSLQRWRLTLRLLGEAIVSILFRRRWCGFKYYSVDPRVQAVRYLFSPSTLTWKENEMTVVHPPYLIPHLLRTIPHPGIKVVSALHMNLEKAIQSPSPFTAAWYRHWVARERLISIPRYATSEAAKEAAERLGIPIRKVIHDGNLDFRLFRPGPPRPHQGRALVISLYCDPNPQKGQGVGVEAVRTLKSALPSVRLCSIGQVIPQYANVFDRNYGYLHGEALVEAIQSSDIFVYPSLYDGFPAPPLQAMACGTALVTTAVEGVTEYGVEGQNCLFCEPGDAEGMRRQIIRLIRDSDLRERLRSNGPKTAQAFSVERSAQQLLEFLQEVYNEPLYP